MFCLIINIGNCRELKSDFEQTIFGKLDDATDDFIIFVLIHLNYKILMGIISANRHLIDWICGPSVAK